jgi:hypothetical protein
MLAALSGFRPQVACRSSDYRFMSAFVGAGVGVALVPSLALTGSPLVRDLPITPQPTHYTGAWILRRHQPNPAAERLLTALRARALAYPPPRPDTADAARRAQGTEPPGLTLGQPPQIDYSVSLRSPRQQGEISAISAALGAAVADGRPRLGFSAGLVSAMALGALAGQRDAMAVATWSAHR